MRNLIATIVMLCAVSAHAETAPAQSTPVQAEILKQLQKVTGKQNNKDTLGQVIATGTLLGCTQKTVGKEATEKFYRQMQGAVKTAEGYCKQGHATEARALVLSTFAEQKDNDVVQAALGCYDAQKESIAAIGGAKMAKNAADYARWIRNPAAAEKEIKEADICK